MDGISSVSWRSLAGQRFYIVYGGRFRVHRIRVNFRRDDVRSSNIGRAPTS